MLTPSIDQIGNAINDDNQLNSLGKIIFCEFANLFFLDDNLGKVKELEELYDEIMKSFDFDHLDNKEGMCFLGPNNRYI